MNFEFGNVTYSSPDFSHGSEATLQCEELTMFTVTPKRVTCENGVWVTNSSILEIFPCAPLIHSETSDSSAYEEESLFGVCTTREDCEIKAINDYVSCGTQFILGLWIFYRYLLFKRPKKCDEGVCL